MSQLARRENAPHRAAFVTSLSRWYIRRLLGNLPPFHPCLSAERRPRIVPCETSSPYGRIPWKSRYSKPFLSSSQCIRNWSRSSGGTSRIIRECSSGDRVARLGSGLIIFKGRKTGYAGGTEVSHAYPVLSFRKSVGA